jgi:hypothetical protein
MTFTAPILDAQPSGTPPAQASGSPDAQYQVQDPVAFQPAPQGAPLPTTGQMQPQDPSVEAQQPQVSANAGQQQPLQNAPAGSMQALPPVQTHAQRLLQTARAITSAMSPGGFYKTAIDPNTGETTRTEQPVSGRSIGLAIALEALTGGLAGAGAHGPNAIGQAAQAGLQQGEKIAQQHQDQQAQLDQQAQTDQNTQFAVLNGNLRVSQNAQMLGKQDQEMHNASVAAYAPQLAYVQENAPDSIQASKVSEQDAKDMKRWPVTQYQRVPDGVVPRLNSDGSQTFVDYRGRVVDPNTRGARPAWDNTYSIVDSKASAPLTDDSGNPLPQVKSAMKWGFIQTNGNPDARLALKPVPLATFNIAVHKAQTMDLAQNEVNNFRKVTGQDPVDLHQFVDANQSLPKAIDRFHVLLNANKHSYAAALGQLAKEDPQGAAGVAAMFGGPDEIHKFDVKQKAADDAEEEKAKQAAKPVTVADAFSIVNDPTATPEQKKQAQGVLNSDTRHAAGKAGAEEAARVANNPNANGGQAGNNVAAMGEAIASGNGGTLDDITDRKTRAAVSAYLSEHHPNLDQKSVTLKGDEAKRRDTAENAMHNLDIIQAQLQQDPTLLGKLQGRITQGRVYFGTDDPHLASIDEALDNYVNLTVGAHSMRSVEARKDALKAVFNNFQNSPQATIAAMNTARESLRKTADLGKPKGVNGSDYIVTPKPQAPGQVIDNATIHKYVAKYGSAAAARAAAQNDGWGMPKPAGSQ